MQEFELVSNHSSEHAIAFQYQPLIILIINDCIYKTNKNILQLLFYIKYINLHKHNIIN